MGVSEMRRTADLGKFTLAGAVVALAYAVTCASSAETFSDFDTRTIAAFGGTVNAVLLAGALLLLRRFRTPPAMTYGFRPDDGSFKDPRSAAQATALR